ncbi:hypothetical protein AAFC00_003660 [Neodothiora populina]|uniref:PIPK domain-containing protein n=1 Tax=Neodothiora populina TaxID=2781224 RepID=A0ABR3PEX5_9PEZI
MSREDRIAASIAKAISTEQSSKKQPVYSRFLIAIASFFALFSLRFVRFRDDLFRDLRSQIWLLDESSYLQSFESRESLVAKGDMGYSGSTFFSTNDDRFLVKSVPRRFENSFFRNDLLVPYVDHVKAHQGSLLVRILDFLCWRYTSLGGILGLAPTHHIVMENLALGKDQATEQGEGKWEAFDLKPEDYFFPERDIAGGNLSSEATKARLVDKFDGKIVLTHAQADGFMAQLEQDTKLLEQCNAVDYSLFLIRIPKHQDPFADDAQHDEAPMPPQEAPLVPSPPPTWRTGIESADGKYVFRAVVLDFFWAKHKVQAKLFTLLIKGWNLIDRQGPMSITTTPDEYRTRFLKMCSHIIEAR